jgi:hypothetical protein
MYENIGNLDREVKLHIKHNIIPTLNERAYDLIGELFIEQIPIQNVIFSEKSYNSKNEIECIFVTFDEEDESEYQSVINEYSDDTYGIKYKFNYNSKFIYKTIIDKLNETLDNVLVNNPLYINNDVYVLQFASLDE